MFWAPACIRAGTEQVEAADDLKASVFKRMPGRPGGLLATTVEIDERIH